MSQSPRPLWPRPADRSYDEARAECYRVGPTCPLEAKLGGQEVALQMLWLATMSRRTTISSSDLIWRFHERLKEVHHGTAPNFPLAVVPLANADWTVVMNARRRAQSPAFVRCVRELEKQFRKVYALKD